MLPVSQAITLAAADDDGICASQTPGAAGAMSINGQLASGGVATLTPYRSGYARQVLFTFAADETGHSFTVVGTGAQGETITEIVAGTATTAVTVNMFSSITSITISAAATGAIKVGTNGVGATRWINLDVFEDPFSASIQVVVSGTVNFTTEYTYDDVQTNANPTLWPISALTSKAANTEGALTVACRYVRTKVNSGTGVATTTVIQPGLGGYG